MSTKRWMSTEDRAGARSQPSRSVSTASHERDQQRPHPATLVGGATVDSASLTQADVLQLQRTIGNQATQHLLSQKAEPSAAGNRLTESLAQAHTFESSEPVVDAVGRTTSPSPGCGQFGQPGAQRGRHEVYSNSQATGLMKTTEDEKVQFVSGRTVGEFFGDMARPVGAALGNVVGSIAGAVTGVSISTTTNAGPTWNNHGDFDWRVGFNTTGRNGWIVQEIVNTYRAEDALGNDLGAHPTPHLWEAWAVDGAGNVTPNVGPNNDYYIRPSRGNNTEGHWSISGSAYFTTTDPATQGFAVGNVPDAGILLSATAAPPDLGIARLHRYAQGTWDSTGVAPTHTGSAWP